MRAPIRVSRAGPRYTSARWVAPHAGIRIAAEHAHDPEVRIYAAGLIIPKTAALTGWAAARVHGDRWSDGRTAAGIELPVPVAVPHEARLRRRGLAPIKGKLEADDVQLVYGLRVVSPVRTAFDQARLLETELAVIAVDCLLAAKAVTLDRLSTYVDAHPGMKGVPRAREVLSLVSPYAESPQESRMRMFWRSIGIGNVLVNPIIVDDGGHFVGRVDLLDAEAGLVGEYQGDVHRDPAQWRKDLRRKRRLESLGLIVSEAAGGDLRIGSQYARDLVRARHAGLRRDRRLDRWQVIQPERIVGRDEPWWLDGS